MTFPNHLLGATLDKNMSARTAESIPETEFCNFDGSVNCELVPIEFSECYFKQCDENQYPYFINDEFQYPSASASYSGNESEQNIVSLLDTDFLEIYDELAKSDEFFFSGPSPVAMPIAFATEAEIIRLDTNESIQHATLIEPSEPKILKELNDPEVKTEHKILRQTKKKNRISAISKWKLKRNRDVCKASDLNIMSARQEATARRPRTHGKFRKVKAKWITATEYFHLEPKLEEESLDSSNIADTVEYSASS